MDSLFPLLALVLGILIIGFLYRFFARRRTLFTPRELSDLQSRFDDLEKRVYWDPRHAVMEGDKLLDLLLRKRGYKGTLGDKLKKAHKHFPQVQELWDAHKIRNRIAHELDVRVEPREAKRAITAYKTAYRQSGVDIR